MWEQHGFGPARSSTHLDSLKKRKLVGIWLLSSALIQGWIAYQMWGERGERNREALRQYLTKGQDQNNK
ncbi:hypothetical protein PTSG_05684 [Salpingoeca rosetta]|uniref:Uncharacterized protein n=1 Tax=Salpingoeca rosetta (strain ATCC 50818 / BSB-021) TaxID=946362 RepID=F2UBX3_SALR5|nr:uncharacterized protein PTSG_05684 [Salpingoeca rosetta]EGD73989.1 hypothetical protein PTSG_05684 [Salpingoeca rosetta]|eukprot:XP_004993552.1 hypothetical protein PTSG_05684 [Salpingoeca rosetta]